MGKLFRVEDQPKKKVGFWHWTALTVVVVLFVLCMVQTSPSGKRVLEWQVAKVKVRLFGHKTFVVKGERCDSCHRNP